MILPKQFILWTALVVTGVLFWWAWPDSKGGELGEELSALARLIDLEGHEGQQASWLSNWERLVDLSSREQVRDGVRHFLDSGDNALLSKRFEFSADGSLGMMPDLRAYLLYSWYQSYPGDASRWILNRDARAVVSPGEMGMMAHLAGRDATATLEGLWQASLDRSGWWLGGDAAVLELVDIGVALGASEDILDLFSRHGQEAGQGFRFAMFLALDRLMMEAPAKTWNAIAKEDWLWSEWPLSVASWATRLDPGNPVQEEALEAFLLGAATTEEQVLHFAGLMPNFNAALSRNLVTPSPVPSASEVKARISSTWEWAGKLSERSDEPHLTMVGQIIRSKVEPWLEPKL